MKKKGLIIILAMLLALCIGAGATFAYLYVNTDPLVNTFTYGDINITLTETTGNSYKMIPGNEIPKDPTVTVEKGSEACWLFIKLEADNNPDTFLTYSLADGWTALDGPTGVYYREVADLTADSATDAVIPVLLNNKVTVKSDVLKTQLALLTDSTLPKLTFTAYAVQKANVDTAAAAWAIANP